MCTDGICRQHLQNRHHCHTWHDLKACKSQKLSSGWPKLHPGYQRLIAQSGKRQKWSVCHGTAITDCPKNGPWMPSISIGTSGSLPFGTQTLMLMACVLMKQGEPTKNIRTILVFIFFFIYYTFIQPCSDVSPLPTTNTQWGYCHATCCNFQYIKKTTLKYSAMTHFFLQHYFMRLSPHTTSFFMCKAIATEMFFAG